jgi:hypothetical protein
MPILQKVLVIMGGILYILGGVFHSLFWKVEFLNWVNELTKLTEINSNVMQMLNIGLIVMFLSFGFIMIYFRNEISSSKLGKALLIFSSLFFLIRLIEEFVFPGSSIIAEVILVVYTLIYLLPVVLKN